jgi:CubicO group peptidase (beta-lactamase class C family)
MYFIFHSPYKALFWSLLILSGIVLFSSCKKSQDLDPTSLAVTFSRPPKVVMQSTTTALLTTTITAAPTGQVLTAGYVWSKSNPKPTVSDNKTSQQITLSSVPYSLSSVLTGLEPNATYYVRAYIADGSTTSYSADTTFQAKITLAELFGKGLTEALQNRNIGYGFVIYDNNTLAASGAGGLRSRSIDPEGQSTFTMDTRMHIASMSKTIAAMAFLQVAAQKNIRTTDKIEPYLPPSWVRGPNIDRITFRDLLTHRSGITGLGAACQNGAYSENIYAGLQQLIRNGVKTANLGQYCYQNANMGLFRVLIPALTGYAFTGSDATDDLQTQQRYVAYIQQQVFDKVGLTSVIPSFQPGQPTYTYDYPYSGRAGWNPGAFAPTVGGYGWYMSARDAGGLYARVLSSTDQSVISTAYKDSLLTQNLGCFRALTPDGYAAYHDGWWYLNAASPYVGLRTIWIKFPGNVTAVLMVNALNSKTGLFPSDDGSDIVTYIFRIYNQAKQLSGGRVTSTTFTLEHSEPH